MRLDDVLVGTTALGFDTAPFIYFVERHPSYLAVMREIIRRVDAGELEGYSSVVTLTEVLTLPMRLGKGGIVQEYRDVLLHSRHFTPIPLNAALAERAALLRARYTLRTPDALQIATALHAGCQSFLTNDRALKRVTDLRVLILQELEL